MNFYFLCKLDELENKVTEIFYMTDVFCKFFGFVTSKHTTDKLLKCEKHRPET